jgi:hypothetical protein
MLSTPKTKYIRDVWKEYALQLLGLNKDWWGIYHNKLSNYAVYRNVEIDGKLCVEEIFSYKRFKQIIDEFFISAKEAVIKGEAVNMGNKIGKICARRLERDHSNRQVNWGRTALQPKVVSEKTGKLVPKKLIYYTEDDYCRISWHKTGQVRNETVYEFAPTEDNKCGTGFKEEFARALKKNVLLKYRYLYYPLQKERRQILKMETANYQSLKATI